LEISTGDGKTLTNGGDFPEDFFAQKGYPLGKRKKQGVMGEKRQIL